MASQNDDTQFDTLIREKHESAEWDLAIARRVMRRRHVYRIRTAAIGSAATAALAAAIVFAILPGASDDLKQGEKLDNLISAQVSGTWTSVMAGAVTASNGISSADADFGADMDTLIDETMAKRL